MVAETTMGKGLSDDTVIPSSFDGVRSEAALQNGDSQQSKPVSLKRTSAATIIEAVPREAQAPIIADDPATAVIPSDTAFPDDDGIAAPVVAKDIVGFFGPGIPDPLKCAGCAPCDACAELAAPTTVAALFLDEEAVRTSIHHRAKQESMPRLRQARNCSAQTGDRIELKIKGTVNGLACRCTNYAATRRPRFFGGQ